MCGITGFIRFDGSRDAITFDDMFYSFSECMERGRQATGFYSPKTGVVKSADAGDTFCKKHEEEIRKALSSRMLIGHCRQATTGFTGRFAEPSRNSNNHPHESENYILVHNGHFGEIPKIKGYKYSGECDSELAVSYIETFGPKKALELFHKQDSYALVFADKRTNEVYFYRNSNPLTFSIDSKGGMLLFGSTSSIVVGMMKTDEKETFGFGQILRGTPILNVPEWVLFRIGTKGLISKELITPRKTITELENAPAEILSKLCMEEFMDDKFPSRKSKSTSAYSSNISDGKEAEREREKFKEYAEEIFAIVVGGQMAMFEPAFTTIQARMN